MTGGALGARQQETEAERAWRTIPIGPGLSGIALLLEDQGDVQVESTVILSRGWLFLDRRDKGSDCLLPASRSCVYD